MEERPADSITTRRFVTADWDQINKVASNLTQFPQILSPTTAFLQIPENSRTGEEQACKRMWP